MANSIEVRSPLLDYRLVEHGLKIPFYHNIKNGYGKQILRSISKRYLSEEISGLKKKGFSIPESDWLLANKNDIKTKYFDSSLTLSREIYDVDELNKISNQFFKYNHKGLNNLIWKIIFFEEWCRQFQD